MNLLTGFFNVDSSELIASTTEWANYTWDSISIFVYIVLGFILVAVAISMIISAIKH